MAKSFANPEAAISAEWLPQRLSRVLVVALLTAGTLLSTALSFGQQNGPPTSGSTAAILFVPATLNPVAGFNPATGALNLAGYSGDGMLANSTSSQFSYPVGMAYDSHGNLFIADASNHVVRRIDAVTGDLSTFAGQQDNPGFYPLPGSSAAGASARFYLLSGLVVDSSDNIYVADRTSDVIWKITPGGIVSVFAGAGTGSCGGPETDALGDGCPANDATFDNPWALGIDVNNNIYIADSYNDLVREVSSTTGNITIFAGVATDAGTFGDCNPTLYSVAGPGPYLATQAHLCFPEGIAFDSNGNAYISSATREIVQMVNSQGQISTFAGTPGVRSFTGNGGPAIASTLNEPAGIYVDPSNRVYISDFFNGEIRAVDSTGNIDDVMGTAQGELNNHSIGEPDTEPIYNTSTGQFSGAANGIYNILMDPNGNILADDSSGNAITSAGTTGAYYFGNQQIYETVTSTFLNARSTAYPPYVIISNPGKVPLNFSGSPSVATLTPSSTPAAFAIAGGTCNFPGALAPGASCTVIVSFTPTVGGSLGTPYTGSITIGSNSSTSPNIIQLSGGGTGTCSYSTSLTSPAPTFSSPPNVTTATQPVTLMNTGLCPISLPPPSIVNNNPVGSSAFAVASNNCPAVLNGGDSCTYNISFTPIALASYSARMELSISGYGNIYSYLNGTGITAPAVSFTPASLVFPPTTDGATAGTLSTAMTNVGNASLTNIVITLAGANPTYFAFSGTNNCGMSLAAGASCTISVNFAPQAALTNYAATVSVTDNAAGTPQTVALNGTGAAGAPPVVINDHETIHTNDALHLLIPVLVVDKEIIHTTDAPSMAEPVLVIDKETIHTTDSPSVQETGPSGYQFIPVTPCRVVDTRNPIGPFGGPELTAGTTREFNIPHSGCNVPGTAVAYSLNVTVVPNGTLSYLTLWPSGQPQPNASTLNSDGRVKANAAIVPAGANGGLSIFVTDPTQVILDINGYFVPSGGSSALAFYPVAPCRIADTRNAPGPLGGPFLPAGGSRNFPAQSSNCDLPATARAYSLNITAVPHTTLDYLTSWPAGQAQPNVSTLNSSTGAVTANAAVVPTGTGGEVSIFVSDAADVILDVDGYFAPPATGGLSLYTAAPCRVIDTRPFPFNGARVVSVEGSTCAVPATAEAYVLNATVVPDGPLNYLTLWLAGSTQPNVSTLNADDGAITSNMAIVPTNNGSIDAYASGTTNLILDFSGYFAP